MNGRKMTSRVVWRAYKDGFDLVQNALKKQEYEREPSEWNLIWAYRDVLDYERKTSRERFDRNWRRKRNHKCPREPEFEWEFYIIAYQDILGVIRDARKKPSQFTPEKNSLCWSFIRILSNVYFNSCDQGRRPALRRNIREMRSMIDIRPTDIATERRREKRRKEKIYAQIMAGRYIRGWRTRRRNAKLKAEAEAPGVIACTEF
jgi:hypothetical protein